MIKMNKKRRIRKAKTMNFKKQNTVNSNFKKKIEKLIKEKLDKNHHGIILVDDVQVIKKNSNVENRIKRLIPSSSRKRKVSPQERIKKTSSMFCEKIKNFNELRKGFIKNSPKKKSIETKKKAPIVPNRVQRLKKKIKIILPRRNVFKINKDRKSLTIGEARKRNRNIRVIQPKSRIKKKNKALLIKEFKRRRNIKIIQPRNNLVNIIKKKKNKPEIAVNDKKDKLQFFKKNIKRKMKRKVRRTFNVGLLIKGVEKDKPQLL